MAGGGLVQIIFTGNQDKYLNQAPEITWFKCVYCRHVPFGIEDHLLLPEQKLSLANTSNQSNTTEFVLRQYGDLVFRPVLKITLPDIEAFYDHDIDYYINLFINKASLDNISTNILLSSIDAIINNTTDKIHTIFINNQLTVTYDYENILYGSYGQNNVIEPMLQSNTPNTSYDKIVKYRTIVNNKNPSLNRCVFYSPYNINYLTTELSKLSKLVFTDKTILTGDDYFELFSKSLYKHITSDDENRYIYSIINNKTPLTSGYETKNIQSSTTDEITFKLEYKFSNMKLLFIYNSNLQLKSIFYIKSFLYSSNNYINKISPVLNLYNSFELLISTKSKIMYISDGFNINKQMNIFEITNMTIHNKSYNIISNMTGKPNMLYFIYIDNSNSTFQSSVPGVEDYYDLFFNGPDITKTDSLLVPLCVLTFNINTQMYEQIYFDYNLLVTDYIYNYKDVLIYDQTIEEISYVLIGNNMFYVNNRSDSNEIMYKYTDSINIHDPLPISNGIIQSDINGNNIFLVSSDDNNVILVSQTNEKYIGKRFLV